MASFTQIREVLDSVAEVTSQHFRLARLELKEDARFIGSRVGLIAALAPLLLVGYGFICVALALTLRRVMPADLAFLLVGVANLVGGLAGIARVARELKGHPVMDTTITELKTTSTVLRAEGKP